MLLHSFVVTALLKTFESLTLKKVSQISLYCRSNSWYWPHHQWKDQISYN